MTVANGYTTVAAVREQLGDSAGKLSLALLESAVSAASRAIDRYTGRRFWADASVTAHTFKPVDAIQVWIDDLSTTAGLVIETDPALDATFTLVWAAGDYQLEPLNQGVVAAGDTATAHAWWQIRAVGTKVFTVHPYRATLRVTARFGWSAVPAEVAQACLIKSVSLFRRKDAPFGIAGFGDMGGVVRIGRNDPDVTDLLAPFLIPV